MKPRARKPSKKRPKNAGQFDGTKPGPGRPKGVPNKVTQEAKRACNELVDDPIYRAKLLADLRKRKIAPAVETMLWDRAKGKVTEKHEIGGPGAFADHSDADIVAELEAFLATQKADA